MGLEEEWRRAGPHNYEISNKGRVRKADTKQIVNPVLSTDGYYQIGFWKHGKCKIYKLHRWVAFLFCDGYFDGAVVDHIDGNPKNNDMTNLRWVTQHQNIWYSYERELQRRLPTPVMQIKDGEIVNEFSSIAEAFNKTGIRHISEVTQGKRKSAGGYQWKKKGRDYHRT